MTLAAGSSDVALAFIEIGALALGLAVLSRIAGRLGITAVPLYLLAGLVFGGGGFVEIDVSQSFADLAAEIGVLLLLFTLGLEYSDVELRNGLKTGLVAGLLDMVRDNFDRVLAAAREIVEGCPSGCDHSCIDCMQTFRNSYYHRYLDRHVVLERLNDRGDDLQEAHEIPPQQPTSHLPDPGSQPVNDPETKLKHLLEAADFSSGQFQQQIRFRQPITLDHQIGSTTPDVYFTGDEDDPDDKGICVYLDGMSASLHGDPATAERDREIRTWLRNNGYQVIEITVVELDDRDAMIRHFRKLARYLSGRELAQRIAADPSWFEAGTRGAR